MKLITNHKWWWLLLIAGSICVSVITSREVAPMGLLISTARHLAFSIVVATIPWLVYRLLRRPLTTEQMMATISMGWLILAIANLSV